jgi:hypothetical protein
VVTPEDLKKDCPHESYDGSYFLHISNNPNIRKFIPQLTLRGAPSENRDITRVYVAPTLLGCFIGYGQAGSEFANKTADGNDEENGYKGGWKIYALPFRAALKPNRKMCMDQKESDEHWMVTYSPDTTEYIPESAGRVFYHQIVLTGRSKKTPEAWVTMYVEITKEDGLRFSENHFLKKGCYRIEGPEQQHVESWRDDKEFKVVPISRGDYQAAKAQSAALLSYKELENPPHYLKW